MRKGRSQRKTRGALPPLSNRSHASAVETRGGGGPQVVTSVTLPRAEPTCENLEPRSPLHETEAIPTSRVDSLAGVERDAPASAGFRADPFAEALSLPTPKAPQTQRTDEAPQPTSRTQPKPHVVRTQATEELPVLKAAPAAMAALPTPDEMSIPPAGDLAVEPIAEQFFSEGELVAHGSTSEEETWHAAPDKVLRKSLPHVVQRRQRFARYVRWAVGSAALVCLAALARTTMSPAAGPRNGAGFGSRPAETPVPAATATATSPVVVIPPAPEPVAAAEPAAASQDRPDEAPKVEATADPPKAVASDKTALQEKNDARRALERGKLGEAIEAGERSVALDPQDGEAWLLLGAAYQEKGKAVDARRCYTACVTEAKRGPIGECRAMLH